MPSCTASSAAMRTTRTPGARGGPRSFPTTVGPIRTTRAIMRSKFFLLLGAALSLHAETGYQGWLRYAPAARPSTVTADSGDPVIATARAELVRGLSGRTVRLECCDAALGADGFKLRTDGGILL